MTDTELQLALACIFFIVIILGLAFLAADFYEKWKDAERERDSARAELHVRTERW